MSISLLPDNPGAWCYRSWDELMAIPREEREKLQLAATRIMFRRLRDRIPALKKLADRQGVDRIEEWLGRLEAFGMLVIYSSGTTGKLSFVPRSYDEFGPWKFHFFNVNQAGTGVNAWKTKLPTFMPG